MFLTGETEIDEYFKYDELVERIEAGLQDKYPGKNPRVVAIAPVRYRVDNDGMDLKFNVEIEFDK